MFDEWGFGGEAYTLEKRSDDVRLGDGGDLGHFVAAVAKVQSIDEPPKQMNV